MRAGATLPSRSLPGGGGGIRRAYKNGRDPPMAGDLSFSRREGLLPAEALACRVHSGAGLRDAVLEAEVTLVHLLLLVHHLPGALVAFGHLIGERHFAKVYRL